MAFLAAAHCEEAKMAALGQSHALLLNSVFSAHSIGQESGVGSTAVPPVYQIHSLMGDYSGIFTSFLLRRTQENVEAIEHSLDSHGNLAGTLLS